MGDGLKRAALEALCSRGPWSGHSWDPANAWTLTAEEVRDLYAAMPFGKYWMEDVLGDTIGSNKCNRATTLLKRAGLIYYDRATRMWRQTGDSNAL